MDLRDKVVVVTGAASGIGRSLARRFAVEGAKAVICSDRDESGVKAVADGIGNQARAYVTDVSREVDIVSLIENVETEVGPIDLFCSNAGIGGGRGIETPDDYWQQIWDVNVMAHVWAARHLVPRMAARGGGYLLNTASAAGLLTQLGSAPYSVTKHAAVGLAEWLAITHGDEGIVVSVLCPQAVRTAMTADNPDGVASIDGMMDPDDLAEVTIGCIQREEFLILPHPEVLQYMRNKVNDYGRWIGGMRKLNRRFQG